MGGNCCSSESPNCKKQINTLDKLAQENAKEALRKNKGISSYSSNEEDSDDEQTENEEESDGKNIKVSDTIEIDEKISCSPSPTDPVMDFNVIDLQFIDKSQRFATNKNKYNIETSDLITNTLQLHLSKDYNVEPHFIESMSTHYDEDIIFTELATNNECKSISECQCIKRIIMALKYYENKIDKTDIIKFCNDKYTQLLNDYHHILFHHDIDIEKLYHSLFTIYDISPCNINKCEYLKRNQRNREEKEINYDNNDESDNVELIFWIDLFDSIHCYFLHIYDYGYRLKIQQHLNNNNNIKQKHYTSEDVKDDYCIDIPFAVLKENILSQKKTLQTINGFNRLNIHKYNASIGSKHDDKNKNVFQKPIRFGSLTPPKPHKPDFNIGLKFYYWSYYKNKQEYVHGKYRDIKEEIMNNTICKLNRNKYELVLKKANKMMNTEYVKTLKADFTKNNHYEIEKDTNIKLENIVSIILYIDYIKLSEELCKTFSAQRASEQMFAIKNRHREFRNWCKVLRETVDLYGVIITKSEKYYIACKYVIAPSLLIRFRAPTSMSKYIEIATRFINDIENGIILELSGSGYDLKGFNCKWLSNFNGENENIFIGGKYRLKLCTVRVLKNNTNFSNYFKAFHYFELMLSGVKISSIEAQTITKYDYKFLNKLITKEIAIHLKDENNNLNMKKKDNMDESGKYIQQMFHYLCNERDTIIIDMILVNNYYKKLERLIMHENIANLVLFNYLGSLFKNCGKIAIYATTEEYKTDLLCVLDEICKPNCNKFEEIRIRCKHIQSGQSWLCNAWSTDLEFKFHSKRWKAKFEVGKGTDFDDVLILTKQKQFKLTRSTTMAYNKLDINRNTNKFGSSLNKLPEM